MNGKIALQGLGVTSDKKRVFLFYAASDQKGFTLRADSSTDGFNFPKFHDRPEIKDGKGKLVNLEKCEKFRIAPLKGKYFLTYKCWSQGKIHLYGAVSKDLIHWRKTGKISTIKEVGLVVPKFTHRGRYVLYFGENSIKIAFSSDLKKWEVLKKAVLEPQKEENYLSLQIGGLTATNEGILLIYAVLKNHANFPQYSLKAALFDRKNPQKLLWCSSRPIWQLPEEWADKKITFLGTVTLNGKLISYWEGDGKEIFAVNLPSIRQLLDWKVNIPSLILNRIKENPILKPILSHFWESKAVFNAAAIYEKGQVHLVYRAIGDHDISMLGYASSKDGTHIDKRLEEPIFVPGKHLKRSPLTPSCFFSPFMSGGGGYGGCEDPRITKIGDRMYMTYVAYDGNGPPRVALTSIDANDFLSHQWNWDKPVLISPPGVVDKNACLLSEKINGKYVIFHRIFPNILIDFVDDLNFDGKGRWLKGDYAIKPRRTYWDSRKVGVGPPPIKTKDGWLMIYHAVGDQDPSRYKIGAMLLDLDDPTRVLYRSNQPVLMPVERYENEGFKKGVVYPCGAVIKDNQLIVYYGGADMFVCAAEAMLSEFINQLKESETARLEPITLRKVYH